jgi:hypothetical protein
MMQALGIFAVTYFLMNGPRWRQVRLDRPTAILLLGMFLLSGSLRLAGFFEWAANAVLIHVHTPTALLIREDDLDHLQARGARQVSWSRSRSSTASGPASSACCP